MIKDYVIIMTKKYDDYVPSVPDIHIDWLSSLFHSNIVYGDFDLNWNWKTLI